MQKEKKLTTKIVHKPQAKRFFYFFIILFLSLSRFLFCSVLFEEVNAPAMKKQRSAHRIDDDGEEKEEEEEVKDEVCGNEDNMRLCFFWLSLSCWCTLYVCQVLHSICIYVMWYNESFYAQVLATVSFYHS